MISTVAGSLCINHNLKFVCLGEVLVMDAPLDQQHEEIIRHESDFSFAGSTHNHITR